MTRLAAAFLKKDFSTAISYRFNFILQLMSIVLQVGGIYFIGSLVGRTEIKALEPYGGNYFAFLLLGIAFTDYVGTSIHTFGASIREGQMIGTLEIMLVSPVGLPTILFCSSLWNYLFTSIKMVIYLSSAALLFGLRLGDANLLSFIVILLLSILCSASIGILYASFIMVIKKGESIITLFTAVGVLLSGLLFPVSLLPEWLKYISDLIPLTYSLEAARLSLLKGYSVTDLHHQIFALFIFSAVLLPLSLVAFYFAVKRAKTLGSLTQY